LKETGGALKKDYAVFGFWMAILPIAVIAAVIHFCGQ